jgi:hypothetical protein
MKHCGARTVTTGRDGIQQGAIPCQNCCATLSHGREIRDRAPLCRRVGNYIASTDA